MSKPKRHKPKEIGLILKQHEAGLTTAEICRQYGISSQTSYRWNANFSAMGTPEVKHLKRLEDEDRRLKLTVADQALDMQAMKMIIGESTEARSEACGDTRSYGQARRQRSASVPDHRAVGG